MVLQSFSVASATNIILSSEFCKGIILPLLKNKHGDATDINMYRGITLSPIISKLFEAVLLHLYDEFL